MRGALMLAKLLLDEDGPRLVPASYVTAGSHPTSEHTVRAHGRNPTSSCVLCSLFSHALGLPQEAYLGFPRIREWEMAAAHYRERFAAYTIQPQDILLRLQNRRLHIGHHAQEFLAGPCVKQEERLTRWTLGVRHTLEVGDALPPFPTATADTLGAEGPGPEGEPLIMGRNDQGGTAGGVIESGQTTENRDTTSERQVGTSRSTLSAATSPATATSTPTFEGEDEPAVRRRRSGLTISERGSRAVSAGQGDGTSRRRCPRPGCNEPPSSEVGQGRRVADAGAPCAYSGEDLDHSAGDPGDGEAPVPVTRSHEKICVRLLNVEPRRALGERSCCPAALRHVPI